MQMQGNLYHAFIHMGDFTQWSELFDLIDEDPLFQKRILAGVTAGILPLVALGFIKSLVDYIKPKDETEYLLSSEANKKHLEESIQQVEDLEEDLDEDLEGLDPEEVEAWKEEIEKEDLLSNAWTENERRKRDEYLK